jgi:hypothetical protein
MMQMTARMILVLATLLLINMLFTYLAQNILEMYKAPFDKREYGVSQPSSDSEFFPVLWGDKINYSTLRLLGFSALSIFALILLRIFSTNQELKRIIALLFPFGIVLLPLGMMLSNYIPNNFGAAIALTGAMSLIISILDASIHLHTGTKNKT